MPPRYGGPRLTAFALRASMHWNAGFLVESRRQRCWVAAGSGASGRGSQESSSRWANKGRNPQEADSTTNCENRITFSGRRYAHCSVCRYVDPQTCDLILRISYTHYSLADQALRRRCIQGCMIASTSTPAQARSHRFSYLWSRSARGGFNNSTCCTH